MNARLATAITPSRPLMSLSDAHMKFYDVALAQGVHDKVLTYDFFRLV
jgi:hypothetical protein